jgi:phage I-like protein
MTAPALKPIAAARQDGKFDLPADGFVHLMPLGEFPASVEFDFEPPAHAPGDVERVGDRWRLSIVQVIDDEAVRKCAETFAGDQLVDYEHFSCRPDCESRAAGWIESVAPRADGLFAGIRWTADGLADVTGGNYRFLSPVFPWDGFEHLGANRYRPTRLDGAGLTNTPNLRGIRAVSNSLKPRVGNTGTAPEQAERKKETETMREQLIQALGLPPEATDEDVLKAVVGLQQRLNEIEQAQAEALVENDLKELGDRVVNRDVVKQALLKDRAGTLAVLNAIKKPEAKPAIVLNAQQAKTPVVEASGADRAKEQERAVEKYRVENKCSRKEAWAAVRRERPELFKQEA